MPAAIDTPVVSGRHDFEAELLSQLEDAIPDRLGVNRRVPDVYLVALLAGEAGLADDHRDAADLGFHQPVVGHLADGLAHQAGHQVFGEGPLDLYRGDVDLRDVDVPPSAEVDGLKPQHQVGVREREPELVTREAQEHRVVEDAALLVTQDAVAGVQGRDLGGISGDHEVDEVFGARSLDPDLALDGHVPHRDPVHECVVLGHGSAVFQRPVGTRVVHYIRL